MQPDQCDEGGPIRKHCHWPAARRRPATSQVVAGKKIPHERRAMPQVGQRMAHHRVRPGFGQRRGAEQLLLPFDPAHHEIARLEPPVDVPLGRPVAAIQQQPAFSLAPGDGKLVLLAEVADAAEVEHDDRMQRMLPRRAQRAVVDELHQREESRHGRDEQDRAAPEGNLRRPRRCRRRGSALRSARSDATRRPRRTVRGPDLRRRAEARAGSGGGEGDRGGQQPDSGEQHVAPDDPDKDEGRRRQRQQRQREPQARSIGAPA